MKIKSAILFHLFEYRWSFVVYYAVILVVFATNVISGFLASSSGGISISGTEYSTAVFLFICGILSMRIQFPFFLQNGVSRITAYVTTLINALITSAGMTVITALIALGVRAIFPCNIGTSFYIIYEPRYRYDVPFATVFFEGLLWSFALNLLCALIGLFLSTMLYRLNRLLKIIVFGGLSAIFFLILPGIDVTITNGKIFSALWDGFLYAMGRLSGSNPYCAVVTFLIASVLFAGGYYLFLRRATVKQ